MRENFLINFNFLFLLYRELARFIAAGRLHCKIDKVGGIVETNRPDSKNYQYQVSCDGIFIYACIIKIF